MRGETVVIYYWTMGRFGERGFGKEPGADSKRTPPPKRPDIVSPPSVAADAALSSRIGRSTPLPTRIGGQGIEHDTLPPAIEASVSHGRGNAVETSNDAGPKRLADDDRFPVGLSEDVRAIATRYLEENPQFKKWEELSILVREYLKNISKLSPTRLSGLTTEQRNGVFRKASELLDALKMPNSDYNVLDKRAFRDTNSLRNLVTILEDLLSKSLVEDPNLSDSIAYIALQEALMGNAPFNFNLTSPSSTLTTEWMLNQDIGRLPGVLRAISAYQKQRDQVDASGIIPSTITDINNQVRLGGLVKLPDDPR